MKNWLDLTKDEKKSLKHEFYNKNGGKVLNVLFYIFKYIFYLVSFGAFFIVIGLIVSKTNNACYGNACENNLIIFISIFIGSFLLAIINSILISNNRKKFEKWLKLKNIDK